MTRRARSFWLSLSVVWVSDFVTNQMVEPLSRDAPASPSGGQGE